MIEIKLPARPDLAEFVADRKKGIGGSDVAAILGKSSFSNIYQLWEDKLSGETTEEPGEALVMGNLMEPYIRDLYEKATGLRVLTTDRSFTDGVLRGHIDGVVAVKLKYSGDADSALLDPDSILIEIKNVGEWAFKKGDWGEAGTDWVPDQYMLQVQTYLGLTGLKKGHLVALVGGSKLRVYEIDFNPELYATIKKAAQEFWDNHIVTKVSPPITYDKTGSAGADLMYKGEPKLEYEPDEKIDRLASNYLMLQEERDRIVLEMEAIEAEIKDSMRAAVVCYGPNWRVNYTPQYFKKNIRWKDVVSELNPSDELIEKYTKETAVKRSFRIAKV